MKKHLDKNDKTLVELTLLGDDSAYEELVIRHQRAVMGTAFKETGNSFLAEDASQDAFVSAWMNLSSIRDGSKFGQWVCSIAKNSARTLLSRYRSTIPSISLDLLQNEDFSEEDGEVTLIAEDYTDLHEAVESLSEKIRETVKLHYFEDKSVAEIALLLGVPEGTVKWRLSEGRKQLRKGYGIMEKTYDENETITARVMRQVEELKLWRLKNDLTGFEDDYRAVLQSVEALDDSKEKSSMLADTLLMGYWWLPGAKNDETFARVKKNAEEGHNDDVMQSVASREWKKYRGSEKTDFMKNVQIPLYREQNYPKTLAYVLFWLGYEYYDKEEYEEAIRCFEEVTETIPAAEVYHANALAAITGIRRLTTARNTGNVLKFNLDATGEVYKRIGNAVCFLMQPGFGGGNPHNSIFWNMAACDSIILDEDMKVGESRTSSDGKVTLRYTEDNAVCDTPAGHFENCSVYVWEGYYSRTSYAETVLCPGIGIVRQTVTRLGETREWVLSDYRICGGEGLLPFAVGNNWSYSPVQGDTARISETENVFTVTGCENGTATLYNCWFNLISGYSDTWEGKTLEVREQYYESVDNDREKLRDVTAAMKRCEELAQTKRQKTHTAVANRVMRRIFSTDTEFNPNTSQKGMWNFFEYDRIGKNAASVTMENDRTYAFEWKNTPIKGDEGHKVLYSFFIDILRDAAGCLWSDEWTDGYHFDEKKDGKYVTKDFCVTGGESITTPAGTFENCRHISFNYDAWDYFSGKSEYWFAPGIGIVRFRHSSGEKYNAVWHLTEYRGTGEGYFPTDDGIFRRYEPDSLGGGWHASAEFTFDVDETGTVMFKDTLGTRDRTSSEKE